jgi:integrase
MPRLRKHQRKEILSKEARSMKLPRWTHHKTAKGHHYYYFDTGQRNLAGKRVLTRLPDLRDPTFGGAHARAVAARTIRKNRSNALTLEQLINRYQRSPEFRALSDSSQRSYRLYLGRAAQLIRSRAGDSPPAASVEPRDVVAMRDTMAETPGAASQAVRAMGALYAWAVKPGQAYAKLNPAHEVTRFQSREHEPWPEPLIEAGLIDEQVGPAIALLYFTGQRINEVVKMRWDDIDGGFMRVFVQKTQRSIDVAILPELATMLATIGDRGLTILTNANGQPWSTGGLRQKLQAWAKLRGEKVVPHGLRKNAVNSLFEAGCSAAEVSGITDQSIGMLEHYARGRNKRTLGRAAVLKFEAARTARNA